MSAAGLVLWEGRSRVDGSPIVAIVTGLDGSSTNRKTGRMAQVYILRRDVAPQEASSAGLDRAICGECPSRRSKGGACYVLVFQGPGVVWRAYKRGVYGRWDGSSLPFHGRMVRWGAYGDPGLVPERVVRTVSRASSGWTGYTHQWAQPWGSRWARRYFMASCDTVEEAVRAGDLGWRWFLATPGGEPALGSILCPASDEAGRRTTCERCGLCNGARAVDGRKNVRIRIHGSLAERARVSTTD